MILQVSRESPSGYGIRTIDLSGRMLLVQAGSGYRNAMHAARPSAPKYSKGADGAGPKHRTL